MKVHLVYFSPNGSTLKVLRNIAKGLNGTEIVEHNVLLRDKRKQRFQFGPDDLVIFGSATAGMLFGKVDEIFDYMIGDSTPFVGVVTYGGGYYGVSLMQIEKKARQRGFLVSALAAFVGPYSLAISESPKRPDDQDAEEQKLFGQSIYDKVIVNKNFTLSKKVKAGWSDHPLYNVVVFARLFMQNKEYRIPKSFKEKAINDDCIKCRKCQRNCPEGAIDPISKKIDLDKCISCFSCVNNCPQKAIQSKSRTLAKINKSFVRDFSKRKEGIILL